MLSRVCTRYTLPECQIRESSGPRFRRAHFMCSRYSRPAGLFTPMHPAIPHIIIEPCWWSEVRQTIRAALLQWFAAGVWTAGAEDRLNQARTRQPSTTKEQEYTENVDRSFAIAR